VQQPEKKNFIHREDAVLKPNFMDEISEDRIKGSWSITKDMTGTTACIKSLLWPGYFAYCTAHTNMFGGVYMGYGIRNKDLSFLL
jgi:radial spoke head protein 9